MLLTHGNRLVSRQAWGESSFGMVLMVSLLLTIVFFLIYSPALTIANWKYLDDC